MKITVDRPKVNTSENHKARLAALNLRYGATAVYRDKGGTFWATGDYTHCGKDIDHNITSMVKIMQVEKLTYLGKSYDSNIYKSQAKVTDWQGAMYLHSTNHLTAVNPELPIETSRSLTL